jgi:hypothetical protein
MITPLHGRDLPAAILALLRRGSVIPAHPLSCSFWAHFAAIDNVVAIKVAPLVVRPTNRGSGNREVTLRRQGLMTSIECLDPHETLSPGQSAGIDQLYATYPERHDDAFVAANLDRRRS